MNKDDIPKPDSTAARVALWRAQHVQSDASPAVITDQIGLELLAPPDDWQRRPDMDLTAMRPFRASIVARARFIEDLVIEQAAQGVDQYVILGAGLDSFAQRRDDIASGLTVFEVDQPGPQAWKRRRLTELGFGIPRWLRLVPVDFEAGGSLWNELMAAGFDANKRAVFASAGVSMYLTRDAIMATMRKVALLAPGSTFVMTFLLPLKYADPEIRPALEMAVKGAQASGTPFISFFTPAEITILARTAGFEKATHVSAETLAQRYFSGRTDGLRPPRNTEEFLVAST